MIVKNDKLSNYDKNILYNGGHYVEIHAEEMSEVDILGGLLELYVKGTQYNKETKTLTVPNEVCDELKEKE